MLDEFKKAQDRLSTHLRRELITSKRKLDEDQSPESEPSNKNLKPNIICMYAKYHKWVFQLFGALMPFQELFAGFGRKDFRRGHLTPKSILHTFTLENDLPKPVYRTEEKLPERVFRSVVEVNNMCYTTPDW